MWMCVRAISRAFTHSGLRHEDRAAPAADGLKFQSATRDYSNFLGGKTTRDHTQQQPACSAQTRLHCELITKKDNPYGASKPFGFVLNVCPKIAVRRATCVRMQFAGHPLHFSTQVRQAHFASGVASACLQ